MSFDALLHRHRLREPGTGHFELPTITGYRPTPLQTIEVSPETTTRHIQLERESR